MLTFQCVYFQSHISDLYFYLYEFLSQLLYLQLYPCLISALCSFSLCEHTSIYQVVALRVNSKLSFHFLGSFFKASLQEPLVLPPPPLFFLLGKVLPSHANHLVFNLAKSHHQLFEALVISAIFSFQYRFQSCCTNLYSDFFH